MFSLMKSDCNSLSYTKNKIDFTIDRNFEMSAFNVSYFKYY